MYASGKRIYEVKCIACHGDTMQGTDVGMPLLGGRGTLTSEAPKKTVESYWPYATSVFSYVRNTMPVSAPGTLTNDEVYSLMAYLLGSAGIVPKDTVMDKDVLTDVEMPNRHGFIRDDRPDIEPDPKLDPTTSPKIRL
jgi:cytochrome c